MGASLSELLAAAQPAPEKADESAAAATAASPQYEPECAAKLDRARGAILRLMQERRPRFVAAFEQMELADHTIRLRVPTPELREEMLRSKTAMLMRIADLAGVAGAIDLEIAVDEQVRAARPIKLEDRVKYITDKNPLVIELRRALDLEVE
ncbi:MAG: DNA polymerase III subunit gamma/tau [Alistipes sp.]|nr:DNA polymerase III subunit gamma/tau [Alistipes sp.]